jgi:hypothetical protein
MSLIENDMNSKHLENEINISNSLDNNLNIEDNAGDDSPRRIIKEEETSLKININNSKIKPNKSYLLYGNHIDNLHPKYLGRSRAFLYINNYPLIIIGPDCKFIMQLYIIIYMQKTVIVFVCYLLLSLFF